MERMLYRKFVSLCFYLYDSVCMAVFVFQCLYGSVCLNVSPIVKIVQKRFFITIIQ